MISDQVDTALTQSLSPGQKDVLRTAVDGRFMDVLSTSTVLGSKELALANESWAVGSTIFEITFGKTPLKANGGGYDAFGEGKIAVGDGDPAGVFAESSGNPKLDDLLNKLLHPDPAQRITVSAARGHEAFKSLSGREDEIRRGLASLT